MQFSTERDFVGINDYKYQRQFMAQHFMILKNNLKYLLLSLKLMFKIAYSLANFERKSGKLLGVKETKWIKNVNYKNL